MTDVAIIDSGGANIASLVHALARLGCNATLTRDSGLISSAARVILPGVGAAADAMTRLAESGLTTIVPALTQPVLGICLGMQLLFEASDEGPTRCLGILPGTARRFVAAAGRPVPHMGWNQLDIVRGDPLLDGIPSGAYAYFVHSYALPPGADTIATCDYGSPFTAAVSHGNFHGTQFHPERSAGIGARILRNFLERC
ncbi:MAG: imidazole glycerol phosphate synthase, glutamine amidotransferase subunit [Proteobacteria bacterium]|nr:imidazole glycerol phosphate synthase, glutamine amidotransferase subunit [Pseudomonadota bacterium]